MNNVTVGFHNTESVTKHILKTIAGDTHMKVDLCSITFKSLKGSFPASLQHHMSFVKFLKIHYEKLKKTQKKRILLHVFPSTLNHLVLYYPAYK